jgi:outer membrane immunogenic protein
MRNTAIAIVAGTALSLAASGLSLAADMPVKAPPAPMAPSWTWTGFYIGGNVGGGWSADPTATFTPNDPFSAAIGAGGPISFNTSGPVGGFQAGYNWQFNQSWLLGVESDFDFSAIAGKGTSNHIEPFFGDTLQQAADEKVQWFGTVRGRVGYLATNSLLLYGTGGFAYGRVAESVNYSNLGPTPFFGPGGSCLIGSPCYSGASARVSTGWTAGGGMELALMNHWTVKAEYLYVSLGSNTFTEANLPTSFVSAPTASITARFSDTNFHVVRAGVNYKF